MKLSRRRHTPEEIIGKLRAVEVDLAKDHGAQAACRRIGVTERTCDRWRKGYGGLRLDQAKRLKELERENAWLGRVVADQVLGLAILKEATASVGELEAASPIQSRTAAAFGAGVTGISVIDFSLQRRVACPPMSVRTAFGWLRSRQGSRRRGIALLVTVLLLGAETAGTLHMLVGRHAISPISGEVFDVEGDGRSSGQGSQSVRGGFAEQVVTPETAHATHGCLVALAMTLQSSTSRAVPSLGPVTHCTARAPRAAEVPVRDSGVPVYRYAPKQSPPQA